jgi:DNA-binding XRE family transcriptional regulator
MTKMKGHKIRERRQTIGLRQKDLAKIVTMSFATINRFERNKGDAKASTLYNISKVLKCQMEDIFRRECNVFTVC